MTTMADLVAETKRMAYGSLADQMNLVSANGTAGQETLELELSVEGVSPGTVVSSGLNTWWVKGVNPATNTLHVIPGYEGSPMGAVQIGDFVTIRPRVTDWYVFTMLNNVIKQLSSPQNGLYKVDSWIDTVDLSWDTYTIPVDAVGMIGLLRVRALYQSATDQWQDLKPHQYQYQRDNGVVRILPQIAQNSALQFVYKMPFTEATSLADDLVTDVGLSESMLDIPPLGVVSTLLRTTESRRAQVQVQGDPRRSGEVAAGSNISASREFDRIFRNRIDDEAARLVHSTGIYRGV